MVARTPRPIDRLDPGWLFLLAGLALLFMTVIIPAQTDLAEARWQRDRALAIEDQRQERLFRHERYLAAIEACEPALVRALAASQLNLVPEGRAPALRPIDPTIDDASVFPGLEPTAIMLPELRLVDSRLARWARDDHERMWLIAAGSMLVMIGLLPWNHRAEPA